MKIVNHVTADGEERILEMLPETERTQIERALAERMTEAACQSAVFLSPSASWLSTSSDEM